ncbi:hypothetical protein Acr_19g0007220 [Actinidia rufa]|uniref:ARM repeat superfamily protein n=1 Tax=Actinidia rufa TaxID=165716 RepID=A0A7J0GAD5_9ERIC|nr:hypothetical protein Acr_19g0007220 [Actinidia rufa]
MTSLEDQLVEAGNKLLHPPSSVNDLLILLEVDTWQGNRVNQPEWAIFGACCLVGCYLSETGKPARARHVKTLAQHGTGQATLFGAQARHVYQVENILSSVEQSPSESMRNALSLSAKALVANNFLRHPDVDMKVAVAACFSEITRITAPDVPYDDNQMRVVLQLIVSSFENLSDKSSKSYDKRISILETLAKVRTGMVMLDLECDGLIAEMFQNFLKAIRDYHPDNVFSSMETIMTLVLEESDDISFELILSMLAIVKRDNQEVLPITCKLVENVFENCARKVEPYLKHAMKSSVFSLNDYSNLVASICSGRTGAVEHNDDNACRELMPSLCLYSSPNPKPNNHQRSHHPQPLRSQQPAPVQPTTSSHPVQPSSHPCVASVQIAQSCTALAQPPRAAQSCTALVQPPLCSQQPSPAVTQPCAANSQQTPRVAQPQPRAAQSSPFPCSLARNPAVLNFHAWSRLFQLYPSGKRKTRGILGKEPKPAEAPTALHDVTFLETVPFFSDSTPSPDPGSKILAADDPIPPRPLPILEPPSSPFASQDPSPCAQAPLLASSPESGMSPPLVSDILPPRYIPHDQANRESVIDAHFRDDSVHGYPKVLSNSIAETGHEDGIADPESSKKPDYAHQADQSFCTNVTSISGPDDSNNGKIIKSESKSQNISKKRGRKSKSPINSTEPADSSRVDKEAERIGGRGKIRSKEVGTSHSEEPTVKVAVPSEIEKETIQLSSPNVTSSSPSGSVPDDAHPKKAGRPNKKDNLIQEGATSSDVSKKASAGTSGTKVKPQRCSGRRAPAGNVLEETTIVLGATKSGGVTASDSLEKPLEQSGSIADVRYSVGDGSLSKKKEEEKRHGRGKSTSEKDATKSSIKDDAKETVSSPKHTSKLLKDEDLLQDTTKSRSKRKRKPRTEKVSILMPL